MVARRQPRERKVESPERVMSREHPFQNEFREEERGAERPGLEPERMDPSLANTPLEHRWIADSVSLRWSDRSEPVLLVDRARTGSSQRWRHPPALEQGGRAARSRQVSTRSGRNMRR